MSSGDVRRIVCAYPGSGKTRLARDYQFEDAKHLRAISELAITDLDLDDYPKFGFPNNLVLDAIRRLSERRSNIVLLGSTNTVIQELLRQDREFVLVYPGMEMQHEMKRRLTQRMTPRPIVKMLDESYMDNLMYYGSLSEDPRIRHVKLQSGEYMSSERIINEILR